LVGDLGSTLSGGQQQRVLLARALYRKPSILFLVEGTANLDMLAERRIMDAFNDLAITRIVVAHRPTAIEGADRIFAVERGCVTELSRELPASGLALVEGA
jgi:ATP-binding cassette subfamily B protein RaxB